MTGMHEDEVVIDDGTVRRLLAAQLPEWADRPIRARQTGPVWPLAARLKAADLRRWA